MRQIKPSTSTQFPVGSKVRVLNSGHCYSGYRDMARYLNIDINIGANPFYNGEIGVVVAKALHEDGERTVLAVRVKRGIGLIDTNGVVEHEEIVATISLKDLKKGMRVKLISDNREHRHWGFKIGEVYTVGKSEYGYAGPTNPNGQIPSTDWGHWKWEVMPVPEPTVEELKAELASVKAKLWEAQWKLDKITSVIKDGIL